MKQIQIHCIDPDGVKMIINRFSGDNTEAGHDLERRKALKNKAIKAAYDWSKVYPNDKFVVVEV